MFYKIIYLCCWLSFSFNLHAESLGKLFYSSEERKEINVKKQQDGFDRLNPTENNLSNENLAKINDNHKVAEQIPVSEPLCNMEYRVDAIIQVENNKSATVFLTPMNNCQQQDITSKANLVQRIEKASIKNKKYYLQKKNIEIGTLITISR